MKATVSRILAICAIAMSTSLPPAVCQNPYYGSMPDVLSLVNVGGNIQMAQFARVDFAQMILDQQRRPSQMQLDHQKNMLASGTISTLDLAAPYKAVNEFNQGAALMRGQHPAEAMAHLQKAITIYPQFVSAHNRLGLVYLDADDVVRARSEFDTAASIDPRFAGSFLNLGRLALSQNDFAAAAFNLQKASSMLPPDPAVLTSLAYAQNGNHEYHRAIETVAQVHSLQHKGMGVAHYIAAIAAMSLQEYPLAETEFSVFLAEEPSHPLAAAARQNIQTLERIQKQAPSDRTSIEHPVPAPTAKIESASSSNSERLRSELTSVSDPVIGEDCGSRESAGVIAQQPSVPAPAASSNRDDQWTFRKTVDEVDVFFTVAGNKHVSDLTLNDILIQDNNKPPAKVLRFSPQSTAPLRLGVLIDTTGSVGQRLSFEKRAAEKILQQLLTKDSDLAFIAGFSDTATVTQDFTADHAALTKGVGQLTSQGGGTALFDAVSFACWKLAAYPEDEEVAKVLIVLTDGEDNAGHTSLRQTVRDEESSGVTVFAISAKEVISDKNEAEKVLQVLAERSGGEALFPGDLRALTRSLNKLHDEIQNRYLIAYEPADFRTDGRYRAINIAVEKEGKQLQVHARKGYYVNLAVNTP